MDIPRASQRPWPCLVLLATLLLTASAGCRRHYYRAQADQEVAQIVAEHETDPRWVLGKLQVYNDPRSRYFDPYDPDRSPMPQDDPASHVYMHCVDGKKGYRRWHRDGDRPELENLDWREELAGYVDLNDQDEVKLTLDASLKLAYVHAPEYQQQLETLYLSALDVSAERFRFDTQFFGGNSTEYVHRGRWLRNPPRDQNTLSTVTDLSLNRRLATAGDLVVGFANSFVWEFTGGNVNVVSSVANFSLVQPLLRRAGRDFALEQLTIVERQMLANLRAFQRYRHGFYTRVAIGDAGVAGPQRRGGFFGGTGLTGFTGTGAGGLGGVGGATNFGRGGFGGAGGGGGGGGAGFAAGGAGQVGGFTGLLQTVQEIRNSEDSLALQLRTLALLEAYLDAGVIDLVQVDQFRQNVESERANLLQLQNNQESALDSFKTGTLGLPPDLPVELEDEAIRQFQFLDRRLTRVLDSIATFQESLGNLPLDADLEQTREVLSRATALSQQATDAYQLIEEDLAALGEQVEVRKRPMNPAEQQRFDQEVQQLQDAYANLQQRFQDAAATLSAVEAELSEETRADALRRMAIWARSLQSLVQEASLVQARARLETVVLDRVELNSVDAFQIALANRLDLMNNRASLVDSWRLINFNAESLKAGLNLVMSGDMRTSGDNPVKFQGPRSTVRMGFEFDAPLTRLLERNNYRQSLIDYQQDRRQLIQFEDSINQTLRQLLRQLEQLEVNLEIQRRAVAIAIRRVDVTQEEFNRPAAPTEPGQSAAQFGPTSALNLLTALSDLRNAQNNFMSVWLNHYATRMRLVRELGVMLLDEEGRWIDVPLDELLHLDAESEELPLPPPVPEEVMVKVEELESRSRRAD